MIISLVAAATENNVIGLKNDLPWDLPNDMKFFVQTTKGHHILSGRKNYSATGKLLPNRTNIIISRSENLKIEGAFVFSSIEEGIAFAKERGETELMIIGGGEIYRQTIKYADKIYLTRIHTELEGDTYFPKVDENTWQLIEEKHQPADDKHQYSFTFLTYTRKK